MTEINFLKEEFPSHLSLLENYSYFSKNLLYEEEDFVRQVICKLKSNIEDWAIKNSKIYTDLHSLNRIFTKDDFQDKKLWYVNSLEKEISHFSTSGSTTGDPFSYIIWNKFLTFLRDENHWKLILEEFDLYDSNRPLQVCILYYFKNTTEVFRSSDILVSINHNVSKFNQHYNHSAKDYNVHFFNLSRYNSDQDLWHEKVLRYLEDNEMDVIITTGPILNTICHYIRKLGFNKKICKLLSHSNEFPLKEDFSFLKENRNIDYYCDHMRCWDGGATFFTCKHETYHLLDNLTYCEEKEGKLVSTDFFSFPAPFVNYWNGDLCSISDEYKRCECGRLYRPFKMLQNRPFALKGTTRLKDIKEQIGSLCFKGDITQVKFDNLNVDIISKRTLIEEEKEKLSSILHEYKINYIDYSS
jgi:hypothetical protein